MMSDIDSMQVNFNPQAVIFLKIVLGIIMLGVALDIRVVDIKNVLRNPKSITAGLIGQFVLLPAFTYLLIVILQPRASVAMGMMIVAACPGGNLSNFFTLFSKGNTALSVSMTFCATVIALVMTPLNITFWASLYSPTAQMVNDVSLNVQEIISSVIFVLGLPLVIGLYIREHAEKLALKMQDVIKVLSVIFFMLIIAGGILANWDNFIAHFHEVMGTVIVHNLSAYALAFIFATLLGVSLYDKKAITIEVGIQNAGLGLTLALEFFAGLGGVALICALWGIWHGISGSILAQVFAKYKTTATIAAKA